MDLGWFNRPLNKYQRLPWKDNTSSTLYSLLSSCTLEDLYPTTSCVVESAAWLTTTHGLSETAGISFILVVWLVYSSFPGPLSMRVFFLAGCIHSHPISHGRPSISYQVILGTGFGLKWRFILMIRYILRDDHSIFRHIHYWRFCWLACGRADSGNIWNSADLVESCGVCHGIIDNYCTPLVYTPYPADH